MPGISSLEERMNRVESATERLEGEVRTIERDTGETKALVSGVLATAKQIAEGVTEIKNELRSQSEWINGEGDTPGLKIRLDRVERFVKVLCWVFGVCAGTMLASISGAALYIFAQVLAKSPPGV